ncbi:uncharacterized protein ACMZJ9_001392 [Mantella aurantiaca]
MCLLFPGLLYILIISVSSGPVYVQRGSDITACDMKCPYDDVTLELYRQCGKEKEKTLLENHCYYNHTKSHDPRLRLDPGSGCWKLTSARKDDSCVYKVWCYSIPEYLISSTDIRILDPVLIYNITSSGVRLGQDTAVRVQFSGEESHVTWEEDGEPLPERYRLIDDNRTLIIPSVQRDDAERTFRVRITNPVSEEIREYRLTDDPMFIRMLEGEDAESSTKLIFLIVPGILAVVIVYIIYQSRSRKSKRKKETKPLNKMDNGSLLAMETRSLLTMENGPVSAMKNGSVPAMKNESVPAKKYGSVPAMENGSVPTMENGSVPAMEKGSVPTMENDSVPAMENGSVPAMENGSGPAMENGSGPAMENGSGPAMENGSVPAMENGSVPAM